MPKYRVYNDIISLLHSRLSAHALSGLMGELCLKPASNHVDYWHHQYREFNQRADALANDAAKGASHLQWHVTSAGAPYLWVQMDGSLHPDGSGSSAILWASERCPSQVWVESEWTLAVSVCLHIAADSVVQTELVAAVLAYCLVEDYISKDFSLSIDGLEGLGAMIVANVLMAKFETGSFCKFSFVG